MMTEEYYEHIKTLDNFIKVKKKYTCKLIITGFTTLILLFLNFYYWTNNTLNQYNYIAVLSALSISFFISLYLFLRYVSSYRITDISPRSVMSRNELVYDNDKLKYKLDLEGKKSILNIEVDEKTNEIAKKPNRIIWIVSFGKEKKVIPEDRYYSEEELMSLTQFNYSAKHERNDIND